VTESARSTPVAALIRATKICVVALGTTGASIASYWALTQYEGNFHVVAQGALYRSAQLTKVELEEVVRDHGIRSILNLRGAHPGDPWYDDEVAASEKLGVAHYDYALSSKRIVTGEQITEILAILGSAPKPLLVHCRSGADRAGLVSALYLFVGQGKTAHEADRELSLAYGHFPYLMSKTRAMDDSFWAYVDRAPPAPVGED
jgi:protein tyrosine/serine phosphatase